MKNLFVCLLFISLIYGCKKDPTPDAYCSIPYYHSNVYLTDSNTLGAYYFFLNQGRRFTLDSSSYAKFYMFYYSPTRKDTIVNLKFYNTNYSNPTCVVDDGYSYVWDYNSISPNTNSFHVDSVKAFIHYHTLKSVLDNHHCISDVAGNDTITYIHKP